MPRKSSDLEHSHVQNGNLNVNSAQKSPSVELKMRRLFKRVKISDTGTDTNNLDEKEKASMVSLLSLFRYADKIDVICMIAATIAAIANGATLPLMLVVFGDVANDFTNSEDDFCNLNFTYFNQFCPLGTTLTAANYLTESKKCNFSQGNVTIPASSDLASDIHKQVMYLVVIGCISIPLAYIQVTFWSIAAERQMRKLRSILFHAILNKEIAYFDTHKGGELNTRLSEDVNKIHNGIGNKLGVGEQNISVFIAGIILGFVKSWKLTMVILSVSPLLFISALFFTQLTGTLTSEELRSYSKAGSIAYEVLSNIRTVYSYNGSAYESARYEKHLQAAKRVGFRKGAINGALQGFIWLITFCSYALGFWYGGKLVREENYSVGDILTLSVFFSIVTAVISLGQTAPHLTALAQARGAAFTLWQIIDTKSKISSDSEDGIKVGNINGNIQFTNVTFSYPSRRDVSVLSGLSIEAKCGETIALVGSSGSGKSTCCQLLQRCYDATTGDILIDNRSIKEYNLNWLRKQIGVVAQEPVLFQKTIYENIRDGNSEATKEEIEESARTANAHDFIMDLPYKYETLVGEGGALLSGGQKQRIAIARALVKNPKILLLDEATSALDSESESIVQQALDQAAKGRTTVVVAHRLSTIVNVSKIYVFNKGSVVEEGNHQQLMVQRGTYYSLVEIQTLRASIDGLEEDVLPDNAHFDRVVLKSDDTYSRQDENMDEEEKNNKTKNQKFTFFTMMKLNSPEIWYIVVGCVACICNGGIQPAFGIVFSKLIYVFGECDKVIQQRNILFYVILFIAFGFFMLITNFLQSFLFAVSGEKLTERIRARLFRIFLQQEIAYFDDQNNSTGALCTRLSTEASAVQGATGIHIGIVLQTCCNLGAAVILSFVYGWALTLIVLAFLPFIILSGYLDMYFSIGFVTKDKKALEDAGKIAAEAIQNIRTVVQLTKEKQIENDYWDLLSTPYRTAIKGAHISGFLYSISNSVMFFMQAALFAFGSWMVDRGSMNFENVLIVLNCVLFGAMAVGEAASLAPDYSKAIAAAKVILDIFENESKGNDNSNEQERIDNFKGDIEFENLYFNYPNRSDLLKGLNLKILTGQHIALVGSSGCGKSTCIQLIERFYDTNEGHILVDGFDVCKINRQWWRSQIGLVSQEPTLFDGTVKENIAYGDVSREVSMNEIIDAAKDANIHNFIDSLPEGYDTNVGTKGTQLSGGEKQRIAIARALIKRPKILLLDEATSALDSESESIVQEALDRAAEGRTTIIVAHRFSTILNADLIFVIQHGRIAEYGKHDDLLKRRGLYYKLAQLQAKE